MASFLTWVCGPHARITPVNFCPTNSGFPLLKSRQSGGIGPVATPGFHIGPYGPVSSLYPFHGRNNSLVRLKKIWTTFFRTCLLELSETPRWRVSATPGLVPREAPLASPSRVVLSSILHVFPRLPGAVLSDFCRDF